VGNAEILAGLGQIKCNIDSGLQIAILQAGITASLESDQECVVEMQGIYQERRDPLIAGLRGGALPTAAQSHLLCVVPDPCGLHLRTVYLITVA
jgi:LL-diaminopimelate aminotransferase